MGSGRESLVDVARIEFGRRGYAATSVDDIVERAAVTKGAFYHHFPGKREIFLRVVREVRRELSRAAFATHVDHEPFVARSRQSRRLKLSLEQTDAEVWLQLVARCRRFIDWHTAPEVYRIVVNDAPSVLPWDEWRRVRTNTG